MKAPAGGFVVGTERLDRERHAPYSEDAMENPDATPNKKTKGGGLKVRADDGYRAVSTDLEQAESRVVAGLVWEATGDRGYLDACLSSDLHTTVVQMAWPERAWKPNDHAHNRTLADGPCDLHPSYTYRDVAKRIGHGSNYGGTPFGIAQAVGIPSPVVEAFQRRYFAAFPGIPAWHLHVRNQLQSNLYLDTPLLRRRYFFARPNEDSTLREAIAFVPQSTVAELLNMIMLKCWLRSFNANDPLFSLQLLLQNHDAFLFQIPMSHDLSVTIHEVNHEFTTTTIPFARGDERIDLAIPGEFVTGWNWAYADNDPDKTKWHFRDGNPDGLRKWKGSDERRRVQGAVASAADWIGANAAPSWR